MIPLLAKNSLTQGCVSQLLSSCNVARFASAAASTSDLKAAVAALIPEQQDKLKQLKKQYGAKELGKVTVDMVIGGMRGIPAMLWETSLLDADKGITFRGYSIPQLQAKLPKVKDEPLPEGLLWLLLTGTIPTPAQVASVTEDLRSRSKMPAHVLKVLDALPANAHPMTQFSTGVMALQTGSKFAAAYAKGVHKSKYWDPIYEDSMDLIAKLPELAAIIYRRTYKGGQFIAADPKLDWAANLSHMMGPLHGLANQEVLLWIQELQNKLGPDPSKAQVEQYCKDTLASGKVVPGYGHAVLRQTDPRYTCQREFALKHLPDYPMFKLVSNLYDVVPKVLAATGKVKNPWPNVDAHSGVLLQYYGIKEANFYTVLFGVSRALGVLSQGIWSRALGLPIERPKSLTSEAIIHKCSA